MAISRSDLLKLARAGAATRIQELREEIDGIYRSFPDLRRGGSAKASSTGRPAGRRGWTAAQRKAAAERMRKYWAAKRNKK
jgi:hypothetical protein